MREHTDLQSLFDTFSAKANAIPRLHTLMADWHPEFVIEARDTGERFEVEVNEGRIASVTPRSAETPDRALLLRADEDMLFEVFEGRQSALTAYSDGLLELYGDQRDQTKLDAIALILWGF